MSNPLEITPVQWYPGHMKKTERLMEKHLPLVDIVVEICDARIPKSSRNPALDTILKKKPRIVLLNKSDMAASDTTRAWLDYYKSAGIPAMAADCKSGAGVNNLLPLIRNTLKGRKLKFSSQNFGGIIRMMAAGVPNSGKSSLLNRLAGKKRAKVEDRPGVTRREQWISLGGDIQLLDMPGVCAPKYDDPIVGERLAFTGAIKDAVINTEHLAMRLLALLNGRYSSLLQTRYKLENIQDMDGLELLETIGKKRGMLISGGGVDFERASMMVLDEFRGGLIGRITLEEPNESV